jgi:hypothetical protein
MEKPCVSISPPIDNGPGAQPSCACEALLDAVAAAEEHEATGHIGKGQERDLVLDNEDVARADVERSELGGLHREVREIGDRETGIQHAEADESGGLRLEAVPRLEWLPGDMSASRVGELLPWKLGSGSSDALQSFRQLYRRATVLELETKPRRTPRILQPKAPPRRPSKVVGLCRMRSWMIAACSLPLTIVILE